MLAKTFVATAALIAATASVGFSGVSASAQVRTDGDGRVPFP
jgi:hypothetical protein